MPSVLRTAKFDRDFHALPPSSKVVINDLPYKTEEDQQAFANLVKQVYTSDLISMMPRCACTDDKGLKGEHRVGCVCPRCNSPVRQSIEDDIRPLLWFRKPIGIKKLMLPSVVAMLQDRFSKRNFDPIQYLMDRSYTMQGARPQAYKRMLSDDLPRGYNTFIDNFFDIVKYLIKSPEFRNPKSADRYIKGMVRSSYKDQTDDLLEQMLLENQDNIFCDYIPLPNRSLLVIEQSFSKSYVEGHALSIHNALNTMRSIDVDFHDKRPTVIENRTARILFMLTNYMSEYIEANFKPKHALMRKHVYGSRGNHAIRAVITSHADLRDHDEVLIPWGGAMAAFWDHLLAMLTNDNGQFGQWMHRDATDFLMEHSLKYHPTIDEMFKHMLKNKRFGAAIGLLQRNPSLPRGSAQRVRIPEVKTDPQDTTMSISDLICTVMNADYDGDALHLTLATDRYMEDLMYPFSPFFNLLQISSPLELSSVAAMSDGVVGSASEWLARCRCDYERSRVH